MHLNRSLAPLCSCLTRLASLSIKCEDDWHPGWTVLPHFPPEISALCALTHLSITSKVRTQGEGLHARPSMPPRPAAQEAGTCPAGPALHYRAFSSAPMHGPYCTAAHRRDLLSVPCIDVSASRSAALPASSCPPQGVKEVPAFVSRLGALQDLRLCGCGTPTMCHLCFTGGARACLPRAGSRPGMPRPPKTLPDSNALWGAAGGGHALPVGGKLKASFGGDQLC